MLTPAQNTTLAAAINGDGTLAGAVAAKDWYTIAVAFNALSNPPVSIWRPSVTVQELNTAVDWSAFAVLTVAKQNTYFAMITPGFIDATSANIRGGFNTVFGAGATLTALSALAQRTATRFEALFSTSNVSDVFGQTLSAGDVQKAMGF